MYFIYKFSTCMLQPPPSSIFFVLIFVMFISSTFYLKVIFCEINCFSVYFFWLVVSFLLFCLPGYLFVNNFALKDILSLFLSKFAPFLILLFILIHFYFDLAPSRVVNPGLLLESGSGFHNKFGSGSRFQNIAGSSF